MSFLRHDENIKYGDTLVVYLSYNNLLQFEVERGKINQTKYGALKHDDLVGQKYGSKRQLSKGYVFLLPVSPELWTVSLKHRTQILYATDISFIIYQLDLRPGSVVIESGTGSGSLSHSILRTISPKGHLHTFDFHELRVEMARQEFFQHGFESVTVAHQDVCETGFDLVSVADAVFLDLPKPWLAIPHAKQSLIPGGRLCSFSPCVEQVQRTCQSLVDNSFVAIETWEVLTCEQEVQPIVLPDLNTYCHIKDVPNNTPSHKKSKIDTPQSSLKPIVDCKNDTTVVCTPSLTIPGHTGYLTFATLYPV